MWNKYCLAVLLTACCFVFLQPDGSTEAYPGDLKAPQLRQFLVAFSTEPQEDASESPVLSEHVRYIVWGLFGYFDSMGLEKWRTLLTDDVKLFLVGQVHVYHRSDCIGCQGGHVVAGPLWLRSVHT